MSERFEKLLAELIDGELSENGFQELFELAEASPLLLKELKEQLEAAELLALSEDTLRDSSLFLSALQSRIEEDPFVSNIQTEMKLGRFGRQRRYLLPWGIAAIATIALVTMSVMWRKGDSQTYHEIAKIAASEGMVQWTDTNGEVTEIVAGDSFGAGLIESLFPDSWCTLQFADGTEVTITGQSTLAVAGRDQKVLRLRHGGLSADVVAQPSGFPMLVHTRTAEMKVLGTQFNVDADSDTTRLTVNEGRVRLKRIADGGSVEVAANEQAIVSLDTADRLSTSPQSEPAKLWQCDLRRDVVHGKWSSNAWQLGVQFKKAIAIGEVTEAEAMRQYKEAVSLEDKGSVWAMPSPYGPLVSFRISVESKGPVVAAVGSKLRVRGKLYSDQPVEGFAIGVSSFKPNGGFTGKYIASAAMDGFASDVQSFDILLAFDQFEARTKRFDATPVGKLIRDVWCTLGDHAKLEITEVEIVQ